MPDYENDLAFKPALSWEELCEYAESKGAIISDTYFEIENLRFHKEGGIIYSDEVGYRFISKNRSYEQMKNIIDNLHE